MSFLNRDVIESQVGQIDLLMAMYPDANELVIDPVYLEHLTQARTWCDGNSNETPNLPASIPLTLHIEIENESSNQRRIQLNVEIPFGCCKNEPAIPPTPKVSIRQPNWMSRTDLKDLSEGLPKDDIISVMEYIQEQGQCLLLRQAQDGQAVQSQLQQASKDANQPLLRVWFYFPSLSTREKRQDLVNHAPRYGLTGFVLAGKPGVLCLEGISMNIDAYMKYIKTESWGDIPSHHKKVSERYREMGDTTKHGGTVNRAFSDMVEITDMLGEKRGERANRGDMKALENWLCKKGLGEAFAQVLL